MLNQANNPSEDMMFENVHLIPQTNQLRAMHSVIRDHSASREDFVFYSRRIMRLLIEEAFNLLPFESHDVQTPVGSTYPGLRFTSDLCGVSILRAGESMEMELRAICRSISIGKILIQRDKKTKLPHLYYSSLPSDINQRHVLLLDPMLATGGSAITAIDVLLEQGVKEEQIYFINFITVPEGINAVQNRFPNIKIITSAIDEQLNGDAFILPGIGDFGDRFFGTDK